MKTLKNYLNKIINKPFMDSKGGVYYIKKIEHEVATVIYKNGKEDFFPMFQHQDDKRVYWWQSALRKLNALSRLKYTNDQSNSEKLSKEAPESEKDYVEEHSCCHY